MNAADLSFLPATLRGRARVDGWEVSWPTEDAAAVVDAMARSRLVVLGLDLLDVQDGGQLETTPWSVFEPDPDAEPETNAGAARRAAHAALEQVGPEHAWVLITWE